MPASTEAPGSGRGSTVRPVRRQAMVVVRSGDSDRPPALAEDLLAPPTADASDEDRPTLLGVAPPGAPADLSNETAEIGAARPEASAAPTVARVLRSRWCTALAGCLLGSVATLAVVHGRGPAPARPTEPSAAPSDDKIATPLGASAAALRPAQPVASSAEAPSAAVEVTRVTLEVFPPNAKVTYHGGGFTGPVGEIDVPRGRRVALQISHKGYVTRRLVLDGSKRRVVLGLVRQPVP